MDINLLKQNLTKKGFLPIICETSEEATTTVINLVGSGTTVGMGGSMTSKQLGLDIALQNAGNIVYSHSLVPPSLANQLYDLARNSKWYISSANAITQGGDIVNIDGTANRVSTLIYGVENIIYCIGINKIVNNIDDAIDRIRNYSAPKNARRLQRNTPCAITGKCEYCNSSDCICNTTVISHHPTKLQKQVYVIIIKEELGL